MQYLKEKRPDGCILCMVRDGSAEVVNLLVYEEELFLVSVNLYPYNPGHLLVFPRRHVEDIRDFDETEERALAAVTRHCLAVLDRVYSPSGYNIGYNMGLPAGASIAHLHQHLIPRYPREIGLADLVAGKRVIVETPLESAQRLREAFAGG